MSLNRFLAAPCLALLLAGCRAHADAPIPPVAHVDLSRYLGRWYVIASIPTRFERGGYNPVETYRLQPNGDICTAFRFRSGSFQAPVKTIHSVAAVVPGTGNAEWKVHLFWFMSAQYIVAWLAPDYSQVIVARDKRDYAWLMARTPQISDADYQAMLGRLRAMGYDLSKLQKSPQRWPEPGQPDDTGSTPKSRTVVKGWKTSDPALPACVAFSDCGTARCIRTHRPLLHRASDISCGRRGFSYTCIEPTDVMAALDRKQTSL